MPLWVKKGSLTFPKESDTPVIMVGPGTGVAPFRSALQERTAAGRTGENLHHLLWYLSPRHDDSDVTRLLRLSLLLVFRQRPVLWLPLGVQGLLLQV